MSMGVYWQTEGVSWQIGGAREREAGRNEENKRRERERERREEADEVSMCLSRGMTQQEKETEEKSPEQLSQLRGPSLDRETEKWMDRQRRDMCGCHPAISYAQRETEGRGWGLQGGLRVGA